MTNFLQLSAFFLISFVFFHSHSHPSFYPFLSLFKLGNLAYIVFCLDLPPCLHRCSNCSFISQQESVKQRVLRRHPSKPHFFHTLPVAKHLGLGIHGHLLVPVELQLHKSGKQLSQDVCSGEAAGRVCWRIRVVSSSWTLGFINRLNAIGSEFQLTFQRNFS